MTTDFRFLHMAKTGGIWAAHAMLAAGIVSRTDVEIDFHADLAQTAAFDDLFTIAFVRHPLAWWRSYWAHRMETGWVADDHIDSVAASDQFDEFIRVVVERVPGTAGLLFELYVGPPDRPIEFVGYHEHLAADLERALQYTGARHDVQTLRAVPPLNTSDYSRYPARYTRTLACRLARAERSAIERFYHWMPIPDELVARRRPHAPARPTVVGAATEELVLRARDAVALSYALGRVGARLAETETKLAQLHASKLLRYTRRLRIVYHSLRRRTRSSLEPKQHKIRRPSGTPPRVRRLRVVHGSLSNVMRARESAPPWTRYGSTMEASDTTIRPANSDVIGPQRAGERQIPANDLQPPASAR